MHLEYNLSLSLSMINSNHLVGLLLCILIILNFILLYAKFELYLSSIHTIVSLYLLYLLFVAARSFQSMCTLLLECRNFMFLASVCSFYLILLIQNRLYQSNHYMQLILNQILKELGIRNCH